MSHGLSRIQNSFTPVQNAWQHYAQSVRAAQPVDDVVTVQVRLRQADVGVLYEKQTDLQTRSLQTYEPGEMLDFYA